MKFALLSVSFDHKAYKTHHAEICRTYDPLVLALPLRKVWHVCLFVGKCGVAIRTIPEDTMVTILKSPAAKEAKMKRKDKWWREERVGLD